MLRDYFKREWARLPAMDVSDVAYDAFLVNGQRRINLEARPGERVRLRLINAGASTYFYTIYIHNSIFWMECTVS